MVKIRDMWGMEHEAELVSSTDAPYLEYEYKVREKKYNPNYGDNRMCICGHPYYRHFDSYENMEPVGCKYCGCDEFVEQKEEIRESGMIRKCILCGKDTGDIRIGVCDKCASEYKI